MKNMSDALPNQGTNDKPKICTILSALLLNGLESIQRDCILHSQQRKEDQDLVGLAAS
jgi:hypothetical protein